jgi:hypothetical protein
VLRGEPGDGEREWASLSAGHAADSVPCPGALPGLWLNAALTSPPFRVPLATLEPRQRLHGAVSSFGTACRPYHSF